MRWRNICQTCGRNLRCCWWGCCHEGTLLCPQTSILHSLASELHATCCLCGACKQDILAECSWPVQQLQCAVQQVQSALLTYMREVHRQCDIGQFYMFHGPVHINQNAPSLCCFFKSVMPQPLSSQHGIIPRSISLTQTWTHQTTMLAACMFSSSASSIITHLQQFCLTVLNSKSISFSDFMPFIAPLLSHC